MTARRLVSVAAMNRHAGIASLHGTRAITLSLATQKDFTLRNLFTAAKQRLLPYLAASKAFGAPHWSRSMSSLPSHTALTMPALSPTMTSGNICELSATIASSNEQLAAEAAMNLCCVMHRAENLGRVWHELSPWEVLHAATCTIPSYRSCLFFSAPLSISASAFCPHIYTFSCLLRFIRNEVHLRPFLVSYCGLARGLVQDLLDPGSGSRQEAPMQTDISVRSTPSAAKWMIKVGQKMAPGGFHVALESTSMLLACLCCQDIILWTVCTHFC